MTAKAPPNAMRPGFPLLLVVLAFQAAHFVAIFFSPKPAFYSNVAGLLVAFATAVVCLRQRAMLADPIARLRWLAVGGSFCIWSLAQGWFILQIYRLDGRWAHLRLDEILWVLFGLPLLLVNYINGEEKTDKVQLLDRAQATLFFAVLYLLIVLPSVKLTFEVAFDIQDLA